jgi:hypothetical protein
VLDALARVLQLDDTGTEHLRNLGVEKPHRRRGPRNETVPTGIGKLPATVNLPAFVEGPSTPTGTAPRPDWSPVSATPSAPTPTTLASSNSSARSPWPVPTSGSYGLDTTSANAKAPPSPSTTRR